MGFKKNREYDVEDLTGLLRLILVFGGIKKSESKDYEIGFMLTTDAVNLGENLAISYRK